MARARAPAKVNLFLHVGLPTADGYHPLASWMSFADVGDRLTLELADEMGFAIKGPFAGALAGEAPAANLAWRAALRLLERAGARPPPFRLTLEKRLPVAAGLGGGSTDAGAALRLVREAFVPDAPDTELESVAAELGSDGPACVFARPVLATGRGERLSRAPDAPPLPAVLVNPGVACPTGPVYRAYDARSDRGDAEPPKLPTRFETVEAVIACLRACRNDLEPPAQAVAPEIAHVLRRLREDRDVRLARLSGSGATCFALCATQADAAAAARRIQADRPAWWVRPCILGGEMASRRPRVHETVSAET